MKRSTISNEELSVLCLELSMLLHAGVGTGDALSLLDQCAGGKSAVDEQAILDTLGLAGNVETAALMERLRELIAELKYLHMTDGEILSLLREEGAHND